MQAVSRAAHSSVFRAALSVFAARLSHELAVADCVPLDAEDAGGKIVLVAAGDAHAIRDGRVRGVHGVT